MGEPMYCTYLNYTIGCESDERKSIHTWKLVRISPQIMDTFFPSDSRVQFLRFTTYDGFCRIFPGTNFLGFSHSIGFTDFSSAMGNLMRKPMHSPYDEMYLRMGI